LRLSYSHLSRHTLLLTVCALMLGPAIGYYIGYDHGWERAIGLLQSSPK
jgi:hypothetical protein